MRVLLAADDGVSSCGLKTLLEGLGHAVVERSLSEDLAPELPALAPELMVVTAERFTSDQTQRLRPLGEAAVAPLVLVARSWHKDAAELATQAGVFGCAVEPLDGPALGSVLSVAHSRFRDFRRLWQENAELQEALQSRKLVEKAKGILMERRRISEEEAFRRIRVCSQEENRRLVDIARAIITAGRLL